MSVPSLCAEAYAFPHGGGGGGPAYVNATSPAKNEVLIAFSLHLKRFICFFDVIRYRNNFQASVFADIITM
jgi:hypothetical protein